MKCGYFIKFRRQWLFHIYLVVALVFAIPGEAGVVVDVPTMYRAREHGESQTLHNLQPTLASAMKGSNSIDETLSGVLGDIYRNTSLTSTCARDISRFVDQVKTFFGSSPSGSDETQIETWALQMLDAWAKPPEGILSGHVQTLGDFDECLSIRAPSTSNPLVNQFQGKYCLVYAIPNVGVRPPSQRSQQGSFSGGRTVENLLHILSIVGNAELPFIPSIGSCLPSTCSDREILEILKVAFAQVHLTPVTSFCSIDEPQRLGVGAIVTISFLVGLAFFVMCGSVLDVLIDVRYISPAFQKTKLFAVFHAFSLIANSRKFLSTEISVNDVSCLHGIRFLSASWVVLGHTYLMGIIQPLWNIVDTYTIITSSLSMAVVINAAIVVDVFFVIGGFLVALTLLTLLDKSGGKINVPLLYIHRYLRITPMYMIIICIGTFIFPLLGSGPYWHVAKTWAGYCEKNWWKNALYINNLPIYDTLNDPNDAPCHGMAWYLGVDMQLFILSPFLLFPIWKWKRFGWLPLLCTTIIAAVVPGVLTYLNGYAPTTIPFANRETKYSQEAYTPTYMRAAPYLIGMLTGFAFHTFRRESFKMPRSSVLGAWLVAFVTGFAVLFAPHKFFNPEYEFKNGESAVYASGHRVAWSLAISWLIFACGTGNGGWINQFLSWKPFVPLGRLTFAIYLVSMHLQFLFHLQYRQPIYFSNYHMVNLYFGHLVMSCIIALVCTLLIEAPFMQLLKLVMPENKKQLKQRPDDGNNNNKQRCSISPAPSEISTSTDQASTYGATVNFRSSQAQLIRI